MLGDFGSLGSLGSRLGRLGGGGAPGPQFHLSDSGGTHGLHLQDPGPKDPFSQLGYQSWLQNNPWVTQGMQHGLSALEYLGQSLGKLSRPVKAAAAQMTGLQADPSEYLGFLPFSDALGITDQKNAITGEQLAKHWGAIDDQTHGLGKFGAGLGIDVLTDPLTYLTFGGSGLIKGGIGTAAKATNAIANATRPATAVENLARYIPGLSNFTRDARVLREATAGAEAGAAPLMKLTGHPGTLTEAGQMLGREGLLPSTNAARMSGYGDMTQTGTKQLLELANSGKITDPREINMLADIITGAAFKKPVPLQGLAEVHAPFGLGALLGNPRAVVGTSPTTRALLQPLLGGWGSVPYLQDAWTNAVRFAPGIRQARGLLSGEAGGQMGRTGQDLMENVWKPGERESVANAGKAVTEAKQLLGPNYGRQADRYYRDLGDLGWQVPKPLPASGLGLDPAAAARVERSHLFSKNWLQETSQAAQELGVRQGVVPNYLPRQMTGPGHGKFTGISPRAGAAVQADRAFPDFSQNVLNDIYNNPLYSGMHPGRIQPTPAQILAESGDMARAKDRAAIEGIIADYGHLAGFPQPGWNTINIPVPDDPVTAMMRTILAPYKDQVFPAGSDLDLLRKSLESRSTVQQISQGPRFGPDATKPVAELMGFAKGLAPEYREGALAYGNTVPRSLEAYAGNQARVVNEADTINRALALHAIPSSVLETGVARAQSQLPTDLRQALKELGYEQAGEVKLAERLGSLLNLPLTVDDLAHYSITNDVMKALKQGQVNSKDFAQSGPLGTFLTMLTNAFKTGNTVLHPAFHVMKIASDASKNLISGIFDPNRQGAMKLLGPALDAWKFLSGKTVDGLSKGNFYQKLGNDAAATAEATRDFMGRGLGARIGQHASDLVTRGTTSALDAVPLPGAAGSFAGSEPLWQGVKGLLGIRGVFEPAASGMRYGAEATQTMNPLVRAAEAAAEFTDRFARAWHYFGRIRQGLDPAGAAASAMATFGDYRTMSKFEREWMRKLVPFYAFQRFNTPLYAEMLQANPGQIANLVRAENAADQSTGASSQYLPEFLRGYTAIPLGGAQQETNPASGRQEVNQRYLTPWKLPFQEALNVMGKVGQQVGQAGEWLGGQALPPDQPRPEFWNKDTMRWAGGQLNPMLKAPLEAISGHNLQTGGEQELAQQARWWDDPQMKEYQALARFSPAARWMQSIEREKRNQESGRLDPIESAVNLLLGPVIRNVDINAAQQKEIGQLIQDQALRDPAAHQRQETYVPLESQNLLMSDPRRLGVFQATANQGQMQELSGLQFKLEQLAQIKPRLEQLRAMQASGQLSQADHAELEQKAYAAMYEPVWRLQAQELAWKMATETGIPGLQVAKNPYGKPLQQLRIGLRKVRGDIP